MADNNTRLPRAPMSKGRPSDHQQKQIVVKDSSVIKRCASLPSKAEDNSLSPNPNDYECDYFENPTKLFKKCEEGNWNGAVKRIERYPNEAKTWIVRKSSSDKTVSWRRLPIHEAFRRQPPKELVDLLISAYQNGVKEKDLNDRLPIHHACVYGSTVEVVQCLLTAYPESTKIKDSWGKTAVAYLKSSFRPNKALIEAVEKGPSYYHNVAEVQVRDAVWKASVDIEMQHAEEVEVISKIAQEERDEAHKVIINLEEEISRFSDRLAASLDQENLLMKQIIELQNETENLRSEVAEKECELLNGKQSNQAEIQKLKEMIKDLEFEQRTSIERHQTLKETFAQDDEHNKDLQANYKNEIESLKNRLSEQENVVQEKDSNIAKLKKSLKEMKMKLDEAVESMRAAENSLMEEQKYNDEEFKGFEQHIEEANNEIEALEQKLDETSKELVDTKDQARNEKEIIMGKNRELETSNETLNETLRREMGKNRELETLNETLSETLRREIDEAGDYKEQNVKFEETIEEMKKQNKLLTDSLENTRTQHVNEVNSVKKSLVETQAFHFDELSILEKKHSEKLDEIVRSYEEKISTIKETHRQDVASLENKYSGTIKDLEMKHDGQLFQAREENSAFAKEMEETVSILKCNIEDLKEAKKNIEAESTSKQRKLESKGEQLEEQVKGLLAAKEEVEKEVDFLDSLLPTKDNKIEELENEIVNLKKKEQELENLRERCNEMRDQRDETEYLLYQRNRVTEEERAELTKQLMEAENSKIELTSIHQEEKSHVELQNKGLRCQILELEDSLHQSNEIIENYKNEIERFRVHRLEMGEEIESLNTTIENLTNQNSHSRERLSLTQTSNQDLKDALANAEAEIQQLNGDIKKLQKVILSLEVGNEELERELEKEKELSSIGRQNIERTLDQRITELSSENSRLQSIVDGYLDDLEESKVRNEQIRIELETKLDEAISEKQSIDNQLRKSQRLKEDEMKELASENSRLNKTVDSLKNVIAAKEMEIAEAKNQRQTTTTTTTTTSKRDKTPVPMPMKPTSKEGTGRSDNFYVKVPRNSSYINNERSISRRVENDRGDDASIISEYSRTSMAVDKKEFQDNKVNSRYLARNWGDSGVIGSESRDDAQSVKMRSISRGRCSELAVIKDRSRSSQVNDLATRLNRGNDDEPSRRGRDRDIGRIEGRSSDISSSYRSCSPSVRSRTTPVKTSTRKYSSSQIQSYPPYSPSQADNSAGWNSAGRGLIERNKYVNEDGPISRSASKFSQSSSHHSFDRSESPVSMSKSERIRIKSLISKYDCQ